MRVLALAVLFGGLSGAHSQTLAAQTLTGCLFPDIQYTVAYDAANGTSLFAGAVSGTHGCLSLHPDFAIFFGDMEDATCWTQRQSDNTITYTNKSQSQIVVAGWNALAAAGVPTAYEVGNHDVDGGSGSAQQYCAQGTCAQPRKVDQIWYSAPDTSTSTGCPGTPTPGPLSPAALVGSAPWWFSTSQFFASNQESGNYQNFYLPLTVRGRNILITSVMFHDSARFSPGLPGSDVQTWLQGIAAQYRGYEAINVQHVGAKGQNEGCGGTNSNENVIDFCDVWQHNTDLGIPNMGLEFFGHLYQTHAQNTSAAGLYASGTFAGTGSASGSTLASQFANFQYVDNPGSYAEVAWMGVLSLPPLGGTASITYVSTATGHCLAAYGNTQPSGTWPSCPATYTFPYAANPMPGQGRVVGAR